MNIVEVLEMYSSLIKDKKVEESISCDYLLELFSAYNKDLHALGEIEKAYNFARIQHKDQKRDSGEEYIIHPLNVAIILANMHADKDTICAGLLHDVIEDTGTTELNLAMIFNANIARYVAGVSNLESVDNITHKLDDLAYMRKLITGVRENLEIMLIKLADKLHNMRTLEHKNPKKQRETAIETLELFAPLAGRIGAYLVKNELEDLSLKYINAASYANIKDELNDILIKRKDNIMLIVKELDTYLTAMDINHKIKCSCKNIYGIYKKNTDDLNSIHDLISLQILVDNETQCYEVERLINSLYEVYEQETKDYINKPKANMYRSLHTTIFDSNHDYLQIQVRTPNMDKVANYGFAACWDLSGPFAKQDMQAGIEKNISKPVHAIDRIYTESNEEFLTHIKDEMLKENNIVVYTPTNEAIELPYGATPIDFAYQIHTAIGNSLDYAIVNNEKQDIYYQLHDGDIVEAVVSAKATPNMLWLEHIVTTRAYKKICECLKLIDNERHEKIKKLDK